MNDFLKTLAISVAAGGLLDLLGMFLPWLLGPMLALLLLRQFTSMTFYWPRMLRTIGLILIGVQIGSSFNREAVLLMWLDLPMMVFMTLALVGFALVLALLFRKMTGESIQTSMLGSLPGGLSQMVLLSEDIKSASTTIVTIMQTFRILLVVLVVPFFTIFLGGREGGTALILTEPEFSLPAFMAAAAGGTALYSGMKAVRFPLPEMMAPIVALAAVQSVTGTLLFEMPPILIICAQLFIGARLGLQMEQIGEKMTLRIGAAIVVNNLLLVAFAGGVAYVLSLWISSGLFIDYFLSAAPGGMAEMVLTAIEAGGDVALITGFHLFRIFFILLIAAPAIAYFIKKLDGKTEV
ncbi:AbrB family transcriptional regulator [Planococcus lenghuensis]|uniref:AbrB family transcriptional regulator n=1 Tax=Planococcus lenghuensis TaxID=2213202 RepID=A0A1Q2KXD8_9BACL|nr:AbrB family transcriptional regulator [Planococcus lenghuensis]AQQ52878.1 AbrB family transcriptional regulator [Planococcus lenghuensis]